MNRNVIIGAVLIIAAGLGYYQFSYKPAQEAAAMAEKAAADAKAAEEATAKAAEEAAAKAAEEAKAAADAAAKAAMAAFDPATFNAAAWTTAVDALQVDDAAKATIKTAITAAATDPTKVQAAVDAIKAALGQ